jgi:hypothetical protein
LAAELDAVQLAVYLWTNLEEAAGDMPTMPVAKAFDRRLERLEGGDQVTARYPDRCSARLAAPSRSRDRRMDLERRVDLRWSAPITR